MTLPGELTEDDWWVALAASDDLDLSGAETGPDYDESEADDDALD